MQGERHKDGCFREAFGAFLVAKAAFLSKGDVEETETARLYEALEAATEKVLITPVEVGWMLQEKLAIFELAVFEGDNAVFRDRRDLRWFGALRADLLNAAERAKAGG